jgi:hypothetical protein
MDIAKRRSCVLIGSLAMAWPLVKYLPYLNSLPKPPHGTVKHHRLGCAQLAVMIGRDQYRVGRL